MNTFTLYYYLQKKKKKNNNNNNCGVFFKTEIV